MLFRKLLKKISMPKNLKDVSFAVIDVETTGAKAGNQIIEISLIFIDNLAITDKFTSLVKPKTKIPDNISFLTGIYDEDVENAPFFEEISYKISEYLRDRIIIAHNALFDIKALNDEFSRIDFPPLENKYICTLRLAKRLYPHLPRKGLSALSEKFKLNQKRFHRAEDDALSAAKLFLRFVKELQLKKNINTLEELLKFQYLPPRTVINPYLSEQIAELISKAPSQPGVYFYKNEQDEIIYVGKAKNLSKRLQNYLTLDFDSKSFKVLSKSYSLHYEPLPTELSAELLEAELIQTLQPQYNVNLKKNPRCFFLRINFEQEFPTFIVASKFALENDNFQFFGPFSSARQARIFLQLIHNIFQLRECDDKKLEKGVACYLKDLNRCLAPCVFPDRENYKKELEKAINFLSGDKTYAISYLTEKLKLYSSAKRYEEAAKVRDFIDLVLKQTYKFSIISESINKAKIIVKIISGDNRSLFFYYEGFLMEINQSNETLFNEFIKKYYEKNLSLEYILKTTNASINVRKIRIFLNHLARNKDLVSVYYLSRFKDEAELYKKIYLTS